MLWIHSYKNSRFKEIYDEIKIDDIEKRIPEIIESNYRTILKKDLISLIEDMITKKDINGRIRGEYLTFIKEGMKEKIDFGHRKGIGYW